MLTEEQIKKSFAKLFQSGVLNDELLAKGEELIEQLGLESPLRHRLNEELDELREMCLAKSK